eukprot:9045748-Karenia_brevis.AAC.2
MEVGLVISQSSLAAVAMTAVPGPCTFRHGYVHILPILQPSSYSTRSMGIGSHCSHTAVAQETIGPQCAGKAGSTLPFDPASASMSLMSRSPAPEFTRVAPTACRCLSSVVVATPMTSVPNERPAVPPVFKT